MTVAITELIEIDPDRVDAVGSPANGTEWLILKAVDGDVTETEATMEDVLAELDKATDTPTPCPLCKGSKKIKGGNVTCPKCKGTGIAPKVGQTEKELIQAAKEAGVAASGQPVPPAERCPTCQGNGYIVNGKQGANEAADKCPDCGGSGKDDHAPQIADLNTVDGFGGSMQIGDSRETVDKSELSGADQNDLPDSAFAYIEPGGKKDADGKTVPRDLRHFNINDAAHVRNALARASGGQSPFASKALPKIKAAAKKFGIEVSAKGLVEKDGIISGPNPFLNGSTNSSTTDANATDGSSDSDSSPAPGTPDWEAEDADIATNAATALLQAAELIRQFADREAIEVAAGEGNDVFDTWDAEMALDAVTQAVGILATLAFHEGVAAQKSEDVAEKAGRRLSNKSVTALAVARDKAGDLANHITKLLGDDDPAKSDDDATKSQKDILDMTPDELTALVSETVAKTVLEAKTAKKANKQDVDNTDSIAGGKAANAKAKTKKPKADMTDLEDEADNGDNDSASSPASGAAKAAAKKAKKEARKAAKAARTPEQIEAIRVKKEARKSLRKAQKDEKKAAKNAKLTKAIEEATAEVRNSNAVLQERLSTVEKMAAPSNIVKTRPLGATVKAAERDATEVEITRLERIAKETNDTDVRKGSIERAKELRSKLAS